MRLQAPIKPPINRRLKAQRNQRERMSASVRGSNTLAISCLSLIYIEGHTVLMVPGTARCGPDDHCEFYIHPTVLITHSLRLSRFASVCCGEKSGAAHRAVRAEVAQSGPPSFAVVPGKVLLVV